MKKLLVLSGLLFIFDVSAFAQDVNSKAPDFSAKDLNGNQVKLSDLKGKVVVLDFWASWCVPCKKSMPHLIELYENNKADSLVVLGINVDTDREKINEFQSAINSVISFPLIFDKDSKIPPLYNVEGMPTTVIINKEGVIKYKEVGYDSDLKDKLDKTVKELLAK
jgi:thiol-disulfide isomerase/thioredoxin